MKIIAQLFCLALACGLTACTSTSKRINQNEALFKTYSPGEQRMIRTGQVAVGFDQDMTRMSLGDPSVETTIDTAAGKEIVWEYREIKPSLGVSLGGVMGTGGSGVGIGTGVGVRPDRSKLLKRIYFDRQTGNVSRIESYE